VKENPMVSFGDLSFSADRKSNKNHTLLPLNILVNLAIPKLAALAGAMMVFQIARN
jgi:hypothetical protein